MAMKVKQYTSFRIDPRVQNMIASLNLALKAVFDFHSKVSQKLDWCQVQPLVYYQLRATDLGIKAQMCNAQLRSIGAS